METKAITLSFLEKGAAASPAEYIQNNLLCIEDVFTACNDKLTSAEITGISYSTQCGTIGKIIQDMIALQSYATSAHNQVQESLDGPLFEDFSLNATETISQIKLAEITTDNTFRMEEHTTTVDAEGKLIYQKQIKSSLSMYDFMDIPETGPVGSPMLNNIETVSEFASLFRLDYDTMKKAEGWDVDTCIEAYMTNGEFDHKMHQPIKSLISNILDVTIIKPFIESLTGNEWITGEDLTDSEREYKMAGVIIDTLTLGYGCMVRKAAGYTGKEAAGALIKEMAEDMAVNAGVCAVDYAGTELGISSEINWILSVAAGCTVSMVGSDFVLTFDNIGGTPVTKKLKPNEFQDFLEENVSKILKNNSPDLDNIDTSVLKKVEEVSDLEAISIDGIEGLKKVVNEGGSVPKTGVGNTDISIENFTAKDVPTVKNGEFNEFFNSLSVDELDALWSKPEIRDVIEARLRSPGGLHEWHLVSRTPQFKYWDISAEQIKDLRTLTSEVEFVNPSGVHGGRGSTAAHNELLKIVDTSNDYDTFVRRLNNWANYRLKGGVEALPEGLQIK